ncbi:apolipoprotein N-acyltransferase [Dongshaea marina]|uniref:apolipoprotein N-acyltransferase n=1 Tax=Dongshaea marina TaxID=2047966 RepID=UPI000D3E7C1B|nr:apolipoprotein N-acyltransferase [Dongshaea marina]
MLTIARVKPAGALIAGALAVFSFAPFNIWPLALLSVVALIWLLEDLSAKKAALCGFCYAVGLFLAGLWWIHVSMTEFGGLPLIAAFALILLLSLYLALYKGLACYLLNRFFPAGWSRYLLAFPALWLIAEWARGWVLTGFPWLWMGYGQINSPLAGWAPLLGVEGVTLALLLSCGGLYLAWRQRKLYWLILPIAMFGAGALLKPISWTKQLPAIDVALVQGNIPQELKWDPKQQNATISKYLMLTEQQKKADLIIWPESALPLLEQDVTGLLSFEGKQLAKRHQALITGVIHYNDVTSRFYNAMVVLGEFAPGSKAQYRYNGPNRYYKHHLVPIGEYVPFGEYLRPLALFFNLPMSSFSAGGYVQPNLLAAGWRLASAICYEIAFGEQLRHNIHDNTNFILTVSNDAWFGRSIGPWQHLEIAQMRALEFGRSVLRATNTGITVVIDAKGKIQAELPQFKSGVLTAKVHPATGQTPYNRFGSWPLYLLVMLALITGLLIEKRRSL